jgi:hypothetical protein
MLGGVQHDHSAGGHRWENQLGHAIRACAREAVHLREIFNEGESAATPAIAAGVVVAIVGPLAAILILLDFGIAHFW